MRYTFPEITHLDQVREAIAGRDEFIVAEREGFLVLNYLVTFEDTFPVPNTKDPKLNRLYTLRRECRGLKFYPDETVAARPYHKFFNINERPETAANKIDLTQNFIVLEKLDGSMIHPLLLSGHMVWATKMGLTDTTIPVTAYTDRVTDLKYYDFCHDIIAEGLTPIFEWCSRQQRIVIDYPKDKLVLTAIRNNKTGQYMVYEDMKERAKPYGFPVVNAWYGNVNSLSEFITEMSGREDEEGYVIRFVDGHMYKAKNEWYCNLHKIKQLLEFEKDVIALILREDQDDAKAFMNDEDKAKIDSFTKDLYREMKITAERLEWVVIAAKDNLNNSKKRFALEVIPNQNSLDSGLLFNIWDGLDPLTVVKDMVMANTGSSTKINNIRPLIGGITWERY